MIYRGYETEDSYMKGQWNIICPQDIEKEDKTDKWGME